jgi:hypothetical protein
VKCIFHKMIHSNDNYLKTYLNVCITYNNKSITFFDHLEL